MNRFVLALALLASTSGIVMNSAAMADSYYNNNPAYNNNAYRAQSNANYSRQATDNSMRTANNNYTSGSHYSSEANCINYGWMDHDEIQKWRAKHPGMDVCFNAASFDQNPVHRN